MCDQLDQDQNLDNEVEQEADVRAETPDVNPDTKDFWKEMMVPWADFWEI